MIRPLLLAALLATPAAAQDLAALMAPLPTAEGKDGQLAALAACLAGNGEADATADLFTAAGWERGDDPEMGLIDLFAPTPGLSAMLDAEGGYCEVASGSIGTPDANFAVTRLAMQAQMMLGMAEGPDCGGYTLADAIIVVTSTGQDPTCTSETDSVIRVTFPK